MTLKVVDGEGGLGHAGRRRGALLLASLMLNLLLVGAIAGGLWAARHHGPHGSQRIEQGFFGYVKSLPRARAQALLSDVDQQRQTLRAQRKLLRDRRVAALAAIEAEPFDTDMLKSALAGVAEAETSLEHTGEGVFIDMIGKLSPEERRGYVAWHRHHDGPWREPHTNKAEPK